MTAKRSLPVVKERCVDTAFLFSSGLARAITVPKGTLGDILAHVAFVERELKIPPTVQYLDNPPHWVRQEDWGDVDDDKFCDVARRHNAWVSGLYDLLRRWSTERVKGEKEKITPADAKKFWHAVHPIEVPAERWSRDYYRDRMEHAYDVMRTGSADGVRFGCKLSVKQASAVIWLFSNWLDRHDMRLEVPNGHDHFASSYDGGYDWCEKCGPMNPDDVHQCSRKKCPLLAERAEEMSDDR